MNIMKNLCNLQLMTTHEFSKWLDSKEITRSIGYIQNFYTRMLCYARFNGQNHLQILEEIEAYQKSLHGYDEIAQNFTMFPDAIIAIGRDINKVPPGVNGTARLCVRVEYILDTGNKMQPTSDDVQDYTTWLNAMLCMKFLIKPSSCSILTFSPSETISDIKIPGLPSAFFYHDNVRDAGFDNPFLTS